jgi:hypothetical protein
MKTSRLVLTSALACAVAHASPNATVPLQPAVGQASAHVPAVLKQLDFGGEVFGYYDIDGELEAGVEGISRLYEVVRSSSAESGQELLAISTATFTQAFRILGLFDPKAMGQSSVRLADGRYLNKTFLLTPKGRTGLLGVVGGDAHAFESLAMAPADAQIVVEVELDGAALLETVKALALNLGGRLVLDQLEADLKLPTAPGQGAPTVGQVFAALKTRVTLIVAVDPVKTFKPDYPKGPDLPVPHAILLVEGIAPMLHTIIKAENSSKNGGRETVFETEGRYTIISSAPSKNVPFATTIDLDLKGGQLRVATSKEFLETCISKKGGFTSTEAYKTLSQNMPANGNSLVCMNLSALPKIFETVAKEIQSEDPGMAESIEYGRQFVKAFTQPSLTTLSNLPDGILVTSNSPYSHKNQFMGAGSVVTTGLLPAMAISAFDRVRKQSRQTTLVQDGRILGNSAQRFFLSTGKNKVTFNYDPATGQIKGDLSPWGTTISKGYTVHDNIIESGKEDAFSLSIPGAFDGEPVIFSDEGRTTANPAQ